MEKEYQNLRTEFFKLARDRNGYNISIINAYQWLELDYNTKIKDNLLSRYLRTEEYRFIEASDENKPGDFIIRKEGRKQIIYFSNRGFKRLCLSLRSKKSGLIFDHFIQCEEDYLKALEQSEEENKREMLELKDKCNNFDSILTRAYTERDKYLIKNIRLEKEYNKYKYIDEIFNMGSEYYAQYGTIEGKLIEYFKNKYWRDVEIYIVDPEYMNIKKHKNNDNTSQKENIDDDIDEKNNEFSERFEILKYNISYDEIGPFELVNDYCDELFYYYIPITKIKREKKYYKKIGSIQIIDKNHIIFIKNYFLKFPENKTRFKNIFIASYIEILTSINNYISDLSYIKNKL